MRFILNNSEAKALILHEDFSPVIEEIRDEIPLVKNIIVRKGHETMETAVEKAVGSPLSTIKEADLQSG